MTNNRARGGRQTPIRNLKFAMRHFPCAAQPCFISVSRCLQRFLVAAAFFGGELAGALVQLRGHLGGFFRRTAERDEDLGEFGNFHVAKRGTSY